MKYVKKPVVIDAIEWTGSNVEEAHEFLGKDFIRVEGTSLAVKTWEGSLVAAKGSMLIRGIKGEHYPCEPGVFAGSYDPVVA